MISTAIINEKVDRLLEALARDRRHLQLGLDRLEQLRGNMIKNDVDAMENMLKTIRAESDSHVANEYIRQNLRKELAAILRVDLKEMTLVRIAESVTNPRKHQLLQIRTELKGLTADMKVRFQATAMLIKENARLNTMLLNSLMNSKNENSMTYNARGIASRDTNSAFMNYNL